MRRKSFTRSLALFALAVAANGSAALAALSDYYLKLEGVDGESAAKVAPVQVESFSWGVSNVRSPRDVATGQSSGRRLHQPLTLTMGSLTVGATIADCAKGKHFATAIIGNARSVWTMTDVVISACAANMVTLDYQAVRESPTRRTLK